MEIKHGVFQRWSLSEQGLGELQCWTERVMGWRSEWAGEESTSPGLRVFGNLVTAARIFLLTGI